MTTLRAIMEAFPVTSGPCPFDNYYLNAMSWQSCIQEFKVFVGPQGCGAHQDCKCRFDRIPVAEAYFKDEVGWDLMPKIVFHGKDLRKAEVARQRGNADFAVGLFGEALSSYNLSIRLAPWKKDGENNPCLALGIANRSAVFYRLGRYVECIRDIDQAVIFGYPLEMAKKLLIRKAKAFLTLGYPEDAVFVLETEGKLLNVCQGAAEEICELGGHMKDYADELAFALRKRKEEEDESKDGGSREKRTLKTKFSTGFDREAERKTLGFRHGVGMPLLSKAVQILQCHDFDGTQRHVSFLAKENIDAGDVLMMEPAYVSAVHEQTVHTNCYACLCWTDAPFPCSQCSVIVFCSTTCASGPKAELHARECKFWETFCVVDEDRTVRKRVLGDDYHNRRFIILALRMILTRSPEEWLARIRGQPVQSDGSARFKYLGENLTKVTWFMKYGDSKLLQTSEADISWNIAFIAFYMTKVLETEYFSGTTFSKEMRSRLGTDVARALVLCERNVDIVFELRGDKFENLALSASVLHPLYSAFEKSCEQNTVGIHYGDYMVLRAYRPITKGQLLTVPRMSGSFVHHPLKKRQLLLKAAGYKKCECRACKEDWPQSDQMRADHDRGLTKAKCPNCSQVLGTFRALLKRPATLAKGCPWCSVSEDFLRNHLLDVARKYGLGEKSVDEPLFNPLAAYDIPERLEKVRALRRICVEPCFVLVQAGVLLHQSFLQNGNKRYDDIIHSFNE